MRIIGLRLALSLLWLLLVCYPDPRILAEAVGHTWSPPIDADAVVEWAQELPDHPALIEEAVLERIRYAVPWRTHGVPWAFPSPAKILEINLGDCQSRAVVLASILHVKGIPFEIRASIDHMWVEYSGKPPRALERADGMLWSRRSLEGETGTDWVPRNEFQVPRVDWLETLRLEREYYWDPAPVSRRLLLVAGIAIIWLPVRQFYALLSHVSTIPWGQWAVFSAPKSSAR